MTPTPVSFFDTLWSEDMQHGMKLGKDLRIVNPFRVTRWRRVTRAA